MAEISAAMVRTLRDETGLPMMECKSALTEVGGDPEKAKELLQKRHKGKMQAKSDRQTGEGRIGIYVAPDRRSGALVEVLCETAPVAKNELFVDLANRLAKSVAMQGEKSPDRKTILAAQAADGGKTNEELVADVFGRLRENMNLVYCRKIEGPYVASYVHHDGSIGIVLALDAKPTDETVASDLCMHAVFTKPIAIHRDEVPAEELDKVRRISREMAVEEGKPATIIDKIVEGKVNAFYAERVLMEQEHVKVSKTKVADVLKSAGCNDVVDMAVRSVGKAPPA